MKIIVEVEQGDLFYTGSRMIAAETLTAIGHDVTLALRPGVSIEQIMHIHEQLERPERTNPLESWEDGYHKFDTQKLEPIQLIPEFKTGDMVVNPQPIYLDNHTGGLVNNSNYMYGSGVFSPGENPHVPPNRQGEINTNYGNAETGYRVDFGGWGIWYVRPELLKLRDEAES